MKLQLTFTAWFITLSLAIYSLTFAMPALAADHDHEAMDEHEHGLEVAVDHASEVATMKILVQLLTQLLAALEKKVELQGLGHDHSAHDHSMMHEDEEGLDISVEVHGGRTHIHVYEDDVQTHSFFLDGVDYTDQEAVYDGIVAETGLDRDDVVAAATFPEMTEEAEEHHHNDEEGSHAGMDGLDGLHIMADGTVMLGDGTELDDATIAEDGMVILGDGTEVEPVMDMR